MSKLGWPFTVVVVLCVSLAACGGDEGKADGDGPPPGTAAAAGAGGGTGVGGSFTSGAGSVTSTTSGSGGGGAGGGGGAPATGGAGGSSSTGEGGGPPTGLPSLGSLVVLGDSISDGGGQGPYYYNLLKNDLTAKYGPITYENRAESGSKTGALLGQIDDLPSSLPGPVAVVITSGGNDMKAALVQILTGTDGPAKATMKANIDAALDALLSPGRFGPGVDVHVFEGNIYDASDGKGDFGMHDCAFGKGLPATPTDGFFAAWNGVIADEVAAHGQVLADMHAHFYGHGYSGNPSWYASDCTHPNSLGHDQLRRLFYFKITGEMLP